MEPAGFKAKTFTAGISTNPEGCVDTARKFNLATTFEPSRAFRGMACKLTLAPLALFVGIASVGGYHAAKPRLVQNCVK